MFSFKELIHLHQNDIDIPDIYRKKSLHVALEYADVQEDWINFKKLFKYAPKFLSTHLKATREIFGGYNYEKLTDDEQKKLFE